ncbi:MAG: sulfatase-like hydrolase/transferase, partial [Kiritimatiellales bacterium]|nr:sulfatase-like hydrolase/transferase [Kiritimatiellales bacterium]
TPNLDAMAANGLRFDRFYAGGPVCSPTRASVLTGRSPDRTGVISHGYALHLQEKTLPQALRQAGYATGHFGKWHLDGLKGPGVPILADDTHGPGAFGFDEWLSVTNFFDVDPIMSRMGTFEEFKGDSSEIIVAEALNFIERMQKSNKPSFTVIWYGSPHSPWEASEEDQKPFPTLDSKGKQHHGELVAMDRSIGTLRNGLKQLGLAENVLVWFNSDNGGLPNVGADSVGGLKGNKGSMWEGGLRVPGIVEWPAVIQPRITDYPACVMDIFPTVVDILGLPRGCMGDPIDGISLVPLFKGEIGRRETPLPFQHNTLTVLTDNDGKIIYNRKNGKYELYDLRNDPAETTDVFDKKPEVAARLKQQVTALATSIEKSMGGADYPEGKLTDDAGTTSWVESPAYKPYLGELLKRPEYQGLQKKKKRPRESETNTTP